MSTFVKQLQKTSTSFTRNMTSKASWPAPAGLLSNRYKPEEIPDLSGKYAVVTGGSRGIGFEIAKAMAEKNANVHIISATAEHGEEAIKTITSTLPEGSTGKVTHHQVDLGSLASVQQVSKQLASTLPELHMLCFIAGIGVAPFGLTQDGLGNHFAVNHLSHFLMADILLPKLKETVKGPEDKSVRIVTMSSELHRTAPSDSKFDSIEEMNQERDANALYARSKLMGIQFTREFARRRLTPEGDKIIAIATHPGAVATEQQAGAAEAYGVLGQALQAASKVVFMSPQQGSESALYAATSPKVAERWSELQGAYITEADGKVGTETEQAKDDQLARNLWETSRRALKEKLGYEVAA